MARGFFCKVDERDIIGGIFILNDLMFPLREKGCSAPKCRSVLAIANGNSDLLWIFLKSFLVQAILTWW